MTPHKEPAKLPVDDQLKLLRNTMDKTSYEVSAQGIKLEVVHNEVKILRTEVKDVNQEVKKINRRFDKQERTFEKWKDQLFNKIDKFMGRINTQEQEIGAINARVSRLEKPIRAVVS